MHVERLRQGGDAAPALAAAITGTDWRARWCADIRAGLQALGGTEDAQVTAVLATSGPETEESAQQRGDRTARRARRRETRNAQGWTWRFRNHIGACSERASSIGL